MSEATPDVLDEILGHFKKWMVLIIAACVIVGYASVYFLGKNNPVELEAEKVIEKETGLNIDLTP